MGDIVYQKNGQNIIEMREKFLHSYTQLIHFFSSSFSSVGGFVCEVRSWRNGDGGHCRKHMTLRLSVIASGKNFSLK